MARGGSRFFSMPDLPWPLRFDEIVTYGYTLLSMIKIFERTQDARRGAMVCTILAIAAAGFAAALIRHERAHLQRSAAHDDDDGDGEE